MAERGTADLIVIKVEWRKIVREGTLSSEFDSYLSLDLGLQMTSQVTGLTSAISH